MQFILLFFSLVFFVISPSQAMEQNTVRAYCPMLTELTRTPSTSSWAKYQYTGQASINLPTIHNTLHFKGDSNADKVNYFYGATWTDRTFLCLYNYLDNSIVIYEGQLDPLVERCYFGTPGLSECISSNPNDCPITCVLGSNDEA
jgi:hypothetical protein